MIAKLKPYPAMKDSGVEWLGEVPAHWEVRRGKWLFHHRKQTNVGGEESNVLSLTLRGVVNNDPENPEGLVPKDYATYQLFRKGDLVFKLIDLENLQTSRVGLAHEDGIMSPAYVRLTPKVDLDVHFFYRQYFDLYSRGIYNQLGAGVRSTLGPNDLLELRVLLPPSPEQTAIVRYLDYVGRRVRQFVKAKQRLIGLLEEQKQAIIHRAVTRGLDPDAPLKDSGVEWLGKVPAHWEVRRGKWLFRHRKQINVGGEESNVLSLTLRGVVNNDPGNPEGLVPKDYATYQLFRKGDLVFKLIDLENLQTSRVGLVHEDGIMSSAYLRLTPKVALDIHYFYRQYFDLYQRGIYNKLGAGVRSTLGPHDLLELRMLVPPYSEQAAIVEHLDGITANIDATIARTRREIELLQEYHTRLTADAVTGKLDVRDAAANLPDEPDEPEPIRKAAAATDGKTRCATSARGTHQNRHSS